MRSTGGILFLCLLILFISEAGAQNHTINYGLGFASHEVTKDQRTSLNLTPKNEFTIAEDFEIKFDFSLQRFTNAYGYVLRIIANDSLNIDLVSSPESDQFQDLNVIIKNAPTKLQFDFQNVGLQPSEWIAVRMVFSRKNNQLSLILGGKMKSIDLQLANLRSFRFHFGANDARPFPTSDVPPMTLKDIEIIASKKIIRKWELKKHSQMRVYDLTNNFFAEVKNPIWLLDEHTRWIYKKGFETGPYPSLAFNKKSALLYTIDKQNLYTYDLIDKNFAVNKFSYGTPVYSNTNQLIYMESKNELINYDVYNNKYLSYDFEKNGWLNSDTTFYEPNYGHHNKFFNPYDSALYTFGGYGHFSYKNDFFKYQSQAKKWVKINSKASIPPRYLAAAGFTTSKDKILIFGGYGSESGKQELSPQSFYDLYSIDLKDFQIKKIWELKRSGTSEDLGFSNSLVVNETDSCFYVLSYSKNKYEDYLHLRRYSLHSPDFTVLADSLPFNFHDESSFCDLFISEATDQLIAVTSHKEKERYKLNIYSIHYPPLASDDILQKEPVKTLSTLNYIIIAIFSIVSFVVIVWYIRRRKNSMVYKTPPGEASETGLKDQFVMHHTEGQKIKSAIYFLGGFQVFDKEGHDITGKFTITLKELFVIILIHSIKFEKGISATVIQEDLWSDKDEASARNNRNVNVKKLRSILEEIGDITLENNSPNIRILLGANVFCDYQAVLWALNSIRNDERISNDMFGIVLKNVKRGSLLPNLERGWLDNFKSHFSNSITDILLEYSGRLNITKDNKALLEIADAIFNYDSINQEALIIKCSVLNKKGKYSLAKAWYDHFVKEYKVLYSENYPKSFEEIIG